MQPSHSVVMKSFDFGSDFNPSFSGKADDFVTFAKKPKFSMSKIKEKDRSTLRCAKHR
jgi:hypothetical protein